MPPRSSTTPTASPLPARTPISASRRWPSSWWVLPRRTGKHEGWRRARGGLGTGLGAGPLPRPGARERRPVTGARSALRQRFGGDLACALARAVLIGAAAAGQGGLAAAGAAQNQLDVG